MIERILMRFEYVLLISVAAALMLGCVASQPGANYVYVCADGTQVSNLTLCKVSAPSQPNASAHQAPSQATPPKKQNQTDGAKKNNTSKPAINQTKQQNQTKPQANQFKQPKNQTQPKKNQTTDDNGAPISGDIVVPTDKLNAQMAGNLLLGRPTNDSVGVSVLATAGMEAYAEYGAAPGAYTGRTATLASSNAEPIVIRMDGLRPDTQYYYRIQVRKANETGFSPSAEQTFHTQRLPGEAFTFAVQADPHRDGHTDENLYRATLRNELSTNPDFLVDLGDTFMTEKFATNDDQVVNRYLQDRGFFGIVAGSVPLFNVNGNHDGEFGWAQDGTANNDAVWATMARKKYFLPPYPDSFYSGGSTSEPVVGVRGSYYAWKWGDALFVTLDPYGYTKTDPKASGNDWDWTLGNEQYQWLVHTLESSKAKYKFVFEHHIIGDLRGSTYWAPYYEWGGENRDGTWGFSSQRPDWNLTIRQLFVKTNVTIFFQGHDHLFVKEELDGIVYQTVPQPGSPNGDAAPGAEYNYHGVMLPSSGFMHVSVTPENVTVEYMKTVIGQGPGAGRDNLTGRYVAYNYTIKK